MNLSLETKAKYACLYAGADWGLFWIPLRELEDAGFQGLWITVVYFLIPALCLFPVTIWRWKYVKRGGFQLQLTAIISGGALLLYSTSIVYTDVVRAILLFYLTPVWGIILGRIFLGDKISTPRIIAMILAIIGMLTIFGLGAKFPLPQNLGDWLGLCSGFMWAIAMVLINKNKNHSTIELTIGFPWIFFKPFSNTSHLDESIIIGTFAILGSEDIYLKYFSIISFESSIPSSIFTSIICAPLSICSFATSKAFSKSPFLISFLKIDEPVTLVLSPIFTTLI